MEMVRNSETAPRRTMAQIRRKVAEGKLMSIINSAVESVMDLIDALGLYATITRGAMGTSACITCEVGASSPLEVSVTLHVVKR